MYFSMFVEFIRIWIWVFLGGNFSNTYYLVFQKVLHSYLTTIVRMNTFSVAELDSMIIDQLPLPVLNKNS
jgi:hypothetical protein